MTNEALGRRGEGWSVKEDGDCERRGVGWSVKGGGVLDRT